MTLHPASIPSRALSDQMPAEVPGLAYYAAAALAPRPSRPEARLSPELQALEAHYGYYTPQD